MNPLLNRIYQSQNRKLSKGSKQSNTSQDKVLVPKLNTKIKLQAINTPHYTDRQPHSLTKPYIGRLPSLQKQIDRQQINLTQKRHEHNNKSIGGFRSRRLSSQMKDNDTFILKDEISVMKEDQTFIMKDIKKGLDSRTQKKIFFQDMTMGKLQNIFQRIPTLSKQPLTSQKQCIFLEDNKGKKRAQRHIPSIQLKVYKEEEQQDELFQYLKVLQNNQDLNEQFCYMNRGQKPYSFYIVDYDKRNLKQYLTVSLRGVTHYITEGDQSHHQFFTIKNLSKEIKRYKILKKVSFFKNYLLQKIINHWKLAMVSNKFQNQCHYLTQNLLSQNRINQIYFHQLHSLYQQFSSPNFFNFDINDTVPSLKQLKQNFMVKLKEEIQKNSQFFQKEVRNHLIECLKQNMIKFRIQKRVTVGTSDKLQKSESFLPFDNKKKSMKFTQMAKLKQFQSYLYKIIKYTDMVRYNLKIDQARNGLINSRREMENLFQNYKNRHSSAFTSWVQCKVQVDQQKAQTHLESQGAQGYEGNFLTSQANLLTSNKRKKSTLGKQERPQGYLKKTIRFCPSVDQIRLIFLQHKQQCLKQLWQSHYFLTEQKDQLLCQQVQLQEQQLPTKLDLKYYIQNTPQLIQFDQSFQNSLTKILQEMQKEKNSLSDQILTIYNDSFLQQPIQNYLQNQRLKSYLDSYLTNKQIIQNCEQLVQFGLVILKVESFKSQVRKVFEDKYKAIVTAIPQQVLKRTQSVARQVRDLYFKFKQNPKTIKQFIQFYNTFHSQKVKLFLVQEKIQDLLQLQAMVMGNGIKMPQNSRANIAESQSLFRDLQKRFQEIDVNEERDRKKFQILIDEMIPIIEEKAEYLHKQMTLCDQINNPQTLIETVWQRMKDFQEKYIRIKKKKQQLFTYQEQLKLGHKDLEHYFKLQNVFQWYKKIWSGHQQYLTFYKITKQKGYGQIDNVDAWPLKKHLQNIQKALQQIQAVELLERFKSRTLRTISVIKLSKLIGTDTFQEEHCQKIKSIMTFKVKKIKDLIFTRQGSRNITCDDLYQNTNVSQIEKDLQVIAFLSGRQNVIKNELNEVQELWRKSKLKFKAEDILGNGNLVLRLDANEELQQKIGIYSLSLKNIQKSGHAVGHVLERLLTQIKITKYLSDLLQLWAQVEKQWLKLLPLMTNCPSVKHQSNVFYEFSAVDSTMKKLIKQVSEMSSMRRVIQDHQQKKYMNMLSKCESQLKEINITLQRFLQSKRSLYSRFNFLTDEQLINVIENVKDSKSMARFGSYCFNCEEFEMENQLISGMKTQNETFKLRKAMLRGEAQEMFKSIEENMKTSFRMSIKALIPKMKVSPTIEQQLTQNSLQLCLLGDLILWTQMGQNYLHHESYDEYFLIIKRLYEEMARLLPKINKKLWIKLSIRLTQASNLKQQSQNLIIDQTSKNDFKWKSTMKFYLEEEEISIKQFDMKLYHGLEYYHPNKIFIPTINTQSLLNQMYYSCLHYKVLNVQGPQGQGKRSLIHYTASRLGVYCQEVVCNQNLYINYLDRFLQGTLNSGAWLTFYQSASLKPSVSFQLLERINQMVSNQSPQPKTLFILANHNQDNYQNDNQSSHNQINVYKYHSYTLVEPDHKQISNYLFQIYRFREWQQLSNQLVSYMKTIQPLIQNVIGTPLSLLRKVIDGAGTKKLSSSNTQDETKMLVDVIYRQIIDKSDDKVAILLKKALVSYFNIEQQITDPKLKYVQKLEIFKQILMRKGTKNVLTIGSRSCKSTLISGAMRSLSIEAVKLFPQSQQKYLTQFSIQELNSMPSNKVIIYDGDKVIPQFVDIITSGYLLIDGRKLSIKPKIVLELRNINNCAPSFIQNCQIIYIGNIITKWEKFLKYCPLPENDPIRKVLQQQFGQDLSKLNDEYIQTMAKLINKCKDSCQMNSINKLIIWLLSVFHGQDLWQKNYTGKYNDFTINYKNYQVIPIDFSSHTPVQYTQSNFYFIPTKTTVLLTQFSNCLINLGLHVHFYGPQQVGKTSFLKLFKSQKTLLSVNHQTQYWAQRFKDKLSTVRKQGKNHLIPIGDTSIKIIVDDLDLGMTSHQSFLRSLIEASQFRDSKYQPYFLQNFSMILASRNKDLLSKLDQCLVKVPLLNQSKENLSTIFLTNINQFTKKNNFNREVIDYIDRTVLKSLLIAFDDLTILYDCNVGFSLLMSLVKDLLSIPKKNSFISVQDFTSLFKSLFHQKLVEKSFNKKLSWQLNSIYENIVKIMFENALQRDHWINIESHYTKTTDEEMKASIQGQFKNLIVYPQLIEKVIFINNHFQNINSNVVLMGRKGVGKKYLTKIVSWLNKFQIVETIKDAIFKTIKKQDCILLQEIKSSTKSLFCQLRDCQVDKDLQKFLNLSQKQKLRENMNFSEGNQSTLILKKLRQCVKFVILLNDKYEYFTLSNQIRELSEFSVCLIDEWPIQAILNLYQIPDGNQRHHAELFTKSNSILLENGVNCMSMAIYQKYIRIFSKIYQQKKALLQSKQQSLKKMYFKFNQAGTTIRQWQSKVGSLEIQIIQTIQDLSKQIEIDKINSQMLFSLKKQFDQKQAVIKEKKDVLQKSKNQQQKQLKHTEKILQKIQKIINSLQRTEMSELKKIYKTNKLVEFGLQCLCTLLKEKQDDVNQKTINKLLADPNLLMKMKSSNLLESKNIDLINKFKKDMPSYEQMMKTHTTQTSKILVEWVKSIIEYWQTTEFYNIKRKDFKVLEKQYNEVSADFESIRSELMSLNQRSEQINKQLRRLQQQKQGKQREIMLIKKSLENSSDVIPILLKTQKDIYVLLNKVNLNLNNLLGNCILTAFTVTYLPLKRLTLKSKLIQNAKIYLKSNILPSSQSYINEVISDNLATKNIDEGIETMETLNIFLLQNFTQQVKIVVDPHRKFFNFIQNHKLHSQNEKFTNVIQKAEQLAEQQFKKQNIYHSTSEKIQIQDYKCVIIDWKSIETNPQQKLFNRIAMSKKPQYFQAKNQLRLKVQENLNKIDSMKNELYEVICQSALKILEDQKFLENGRKLIDLQEQNQILEKEIRQKVQLIHGLSDQIKIEVKNIFKLLSIFKMLRPIGLDLVLEVASSQGNSTKNVLSWALANLPQQKRLAFLYYFANQMIGKRHQQLMGEIIVNAPLKVSELKIKKPSLVNVSSWQKILKMSSYSQGLRQMIEIVQKHQKQFQVWCNNEEILLPQSLLPNNLSMNEHLFLIHHLKPKIFGLAVKALTRKQLKEYELKPMESRKILTGISQLFPVIYHGQIYKLQKLCEQVNKSRLKKVRIGSINNENDMKNVIWKCMQNHQWMVIYGFTSQQHLNWLQKTVQYVLNYQSQEDFRIIIIPDTFYQNNLSQKKSLIQSSKYLTSISIHIYDSIPSMTEIIKYFPLYQQSSQNISSHIPTYLQQDIIKSPRITLKAKSRKSSFGQAPQNKITSLLKLDRITIVNKKPQNENLLTLPQQNSQMDNNNSFVMSTKKINKIFNRLYKHIMLAFLVISKRFKHKLGKNTFQILKRCIQTMKYIEQNEVPVQQNVQFIVSYLYKVYQNELAYKERKCLQQIMDRIVDQSKFGQKIIYGVNVAGFANIDNQLANNSSILGVESSFFIRQSIKQTKQLKKTLNELINKQNIKEQTSYLKAIFSKIPVLLSNKEIKNQNYSNFYQKQQKAHNQQIKNTSQLLQWINTYEGKTSAVDEEVQVLNEYNWKNLLTKIQQLVGYKFTRNMVKDVCMNFMMNLRKSHEFLLYFNPSYSSFIVNPVLVNNLQQLISVYTINYFEVNNVRDGYNFVQILEFKRISNNSQLNQMMFQYGMEGIVFNNLKCREFRWIHEQRHVQQILDKDLQGEQKAGVIFLKLRKLNNSKKQQQEMMIDLEIREKSNLREQNKQRVLLTSAVSCTSAYAQFNMRDNCLVVVEDQHQ